MKLCKEYRLDVFGVHVEARLYASDDRLCERILADIEEASKGDCSSSLQALAERVLAEHGGCRYKRDGLDFVVETGDGAIRVEFSLSGLLASTAAGYVERELRRRCGSA